MLLLWGYRRASDNAQLSFRQKIFLGRGKFSNDLSLAKSPLAPFSILSPCCLFLATFSIHSPLLPLPCSVHALYTHPVAPTITTCGSCVHTPSFLPLSPFRPPCSMNDENLFFIFPPNATDTSPSHPSQIQHITSKKQTTKSAIEKFFLNIKYIFTNQRAEIWRNHSGELSLRQNKVGVQKLAQLSLLSDWSFRMKSLSWSFGWCFSTEVSELKFWSINSHKKQYE